jgi:hypothetical protein
LNGHAVVKRGSIELTRGVDIPPLPCDRDLRAVFLEPASVLESDRDDDFTSAIDVAALAVDLDAGEPLSERCRRVELRSDSGAST